MSAPLPEQNPPSGHPFVPGAAFAHLPDIEESMHRALPLRPLVPLAFPLLASTLLACDPADGGAPIDSAPSEEPAEPRAGVPTPEGTPEGWFATVQARIAAEGRAFHPREGAFVADLPTAGLSARLDAEGVEVSGEGGEVLLLRSSAWGRDGALLSIGARAPALGDCTAAVEASGACVRRVELEEAGLTEWWVGLGTGAGAGLGGRGSSLR